ncbi:MULTISPECIES: NAD(P)-dependent oxidoreductase [unclassified Butyrivibrio]|uniref:NAD-dependent epimerase/dehydratase family protein n=1 Tax=unclassified Butyrivibrio TaxID=2639466 RepID=UPI0003B40849|nr:MULTISPECIES: NAD(P)-dependent oxidoreductase [unclassified Butyrivibrio]SDB68564.1 UDP-glucose 4-epimerase [Butyrivibrio sp. INlla16]
MKKILIFGVSGNMGGYLAEYFLQNCSDEYEIIGVDLVEHPTVKKMIKTITMNINDEEEYSKLPTEDVYAVIDMIGPMPARMVGYKPIVYVETNVLGSYKIFDYAVRVKADRILYAKSFIDIVKRGEKQLVLHVDDEPYFDYDNYHSVYCVTQNATKELLRCVHEFYKIKTFTFRLPHIYLWNTNDQYSVKGVPHKMMHRILIDQATAGETIEVWGDPTRQKDMVYVKDLCQMFFKACFVDRETGFYNVGTGIGTPLLKQIEGMRDVFGGEKKSELVFCPEKPNAPQYIMDIKEAVDELGYEPKYSYLEMLEDMKKERELGRF